MFASNSDKRNADTAGIEEKKEGDGHHQGVGPHYQLQKRHKPQGSGYRYDVEDDKPVGPEGKPGTPVVNTGFVDAHVTEEKVDGGGYVLKFRPYEDEAIEDPSFPPFKISVDMKQVEEGKDPIPIRVFADLSASMNTPSPAFSEQHRYFTQWSMVKELLDLAGKLGVEVQLYLLSSKNPSQIDLKDLLTTSSSEEACATNPSQVLAAITDRVPTSACTIVFSTDDKNDDRTRIKPPENVVFIVVGLTSHTGIPRHSPHLTDEQKAALDGNNSRYTRRSTGRTGPGNFSPDVAPNNTVLASAFLRPANPYFTNTLLPDIQTLVNERDRLVHNALAAMSPGEMAAAILSTHLQSHGRETVVTNDNPFWVNVRYGGQAFYVPPNSSTSFVGGIDCTVKTALVAIGERI